MRALKRPSRGVRTRSVLDHEPDATENSDDAVTGEFADGEEFDEPSDQGDFEEDLYNIFRVYCPDCARPIALLADEQVLPEHALCSTPWNPFGLSVCAGSGRAVADARPLDGAMDGTEQDVAVLLTLPAGLDWRKQPFSHAGGPGSRPIRVPRVREPQG